MAADLTKDDISEIARQVAANTLHDQSIAWMRGQQPLVSPAAQENWDRQMRKGAERRAAAEAEEERLRRARAAAAKRRQEEWVRNAPKRAKAEAELAVIEVELARVEARRDELADRQAALEAEAGR